MFEDILYYPKDVRIRIYRYTEELEKYLLGLKCRSRWLRRRGNGLGWDLDDSTYEYLHRNCQKYSRMLVLLKRMYILNKEVYNEQTNL